MGITAAEATAQLSRVETATQLRALINSIDVSSPGSITLLYSGTLPGGRAAHHVAREIAAANANIRFVDKTEAARFLDSDNAELNKKLKLLFGDENPQTFGTPANRFLYGSPDANGIRSPNGVWDDVSRRFAAETTGMVRVLGHMANGWSVFGATELPTLLNASSATSIEGVPLAELKEVAARNGVVGLDETFKRVRLASELSIAASGLNATTTSITVGDFMNPHLLELNKYLEVHPEAHGRLNAYWNGASDVRMSGAEIGERRSTAKAMISLLEGSTGSGSTRVLRSLGALGAVATFTLAASEANAAHAAGDSERAKNIMMEWAVEAAGSEIGASIGGAVAGVSVAAAAVAGAVIAPSLAAALVLGGVLLGGFFGAEGALEFYRLLDDRDGNGRRDVMDRLSNLLFGATSTLTTPLPADLDGARFTIDASLSRSEIAENARNSVAWRYALRELNGFVITDVAYDRHNTDHSLDLLDPVTEQGAMSERYILDRAAMLAWKLRYQRDGARDDDDGTRSGSKPYNEDWDTNQIQGNWDFIDLLNRLPGGQPLKLTIDGSGLSSHNHQVVFGSPQGEAIDGQGDADWLYGMAGNDSLNGQGGPDYLEGHAGNDRLDGGNGADTLLGGAGNDSLNGGSGNDTLNGGRGNDAYSLDADLGHDTIFDADGMGNLTIAGTSITHGIRVPGVSNVWEDAERQYIFTLISGADGTDLVIGKRSAARSPSITGTVTIRNWQAGQLGITLVQDTLPTTPIAYTQHGGFIKKLTSPDSVYYAIDSYGYVNGGPDPNAEDLLGGKAWADQLFGGAGNDGLSGFAGDDEIDGGEGNDLIMGGSGSDRILGGDGNDYIFGSAEGGIAGPRRNDELPPVAPGAEVARGFWWVVYNPPGVDENSYETRAFRNAGIIPVEFDSPNYIDAGKGDDDVSAGTGSDVVMAGDGNDSVDGMAGADVIFGEEGNDYLLGDGTTIPGYGSSTAAHQHGNDWLVGGAGNDTLTGQGGDDQLYGGTGADMLHGDERNLGAGTTGYVPIANHGRDYLSGGEGNDELSGNGNDDELDGDEGDDLLWGDDKQSVLDGSAHGNDVLRGGVGKDTLVGAGGKDILQGGEGDDQLFGDATEELLNSSFHGDDTLDGGAGNDTLSGDGGNDLLEGGEGDDELFGKDGNDTLIGGAGVDAMDGGGGDDTYVIGLSEEGTSGGYVDSIEDDAGRNVVSIDGDSAAVMSRISTNGSGMQVLQFTTGAALAITPASLGSLSRIEFQDKPFSAAQLVGRWGTDASYTGLTNDGRSFAYGGIGNNHLSSNGNRSILSGGVGNDLLVGYGSGNRYLFERGDGIDTIDDRSVQSGVYRAGGGSTIAFGSGISSSDLSFSWDGELEIRIRGSGTDLIRIGGVDAMSGIAPVPISALEFDDGTSLDLNARYRQGFSIMGTAGHEQLFGSGGPDRIDGGPGNDILHGAAGADTYVWSLGSGSDRIVDAILDGETDAVQLSDALTPATLLLLKSGDDLVLHNRSHPDQLRVTNHFLGQGIEKIVFADGTQWSRSDIVDRLSTDLTEADDVATGTAGNDTLLGFGGNDTLDGADGNDSLDGGLGTDSLTGGAGDDWLVDGTVMIGGDGNDRYVVRPTPAGFQTVRIHERVTSALDRDIVLLPAGVTLGSLRFSRLMPNDDLDVVSAIGTVRLVGYFSDDPLRSGVEEICLADGQVLRRDDVIARLETPHRLTPTSGDDQLTGLRFDDAIDAGAGNDSVSGAAGNDSLDGSSGADVLTGGEGNDTLRGGAGLDLVTGSSGSDTYLFGRGSMRDVVVQEHAPSTSGDRIVLDAGILPADLRLVREDVHLVIHVNGADARITVDRYFQTNPSGQPLNLLSRIDFANGTGWTTADIASRVTTPAVTVASSQGIETATANASHVLDATHENLTLTGSLGARLMGNALNNVITGGAGSDILNGPDVTDAREMDGSVRFSNWMNPQLFYGATAFSIAQRGGADTLIGGSGDDLYYTTSSNGELNTYIRDETGIATLDDTVVELAGQGNDTIVTTAYHSGLPENVENLVSFSQQNLWVESANQSSPIAHRYTGNALNNRIDTRQTRGQSRVDGGLGADELIGNAESATIYVVDDPNDRIVEVGSENSSAIDVIETGISYALPDAIESLVLTGSANVTATGNNKANFLDGLLNTAANVLVGAAGNDTYRVGTGDTVVEQTAGGWDTIIIARGTNATHRLGDYAYIEAMALDAVAGSANLVGSSLGDRLEGNIHDNQLDGGDGDDNVSDGFAFDSSQRIWVSGKDRLLGGAGNDTLTSNGGGDYLEGGTGNDSLSVMDVAGSVIAFGRGHGSDTVSGSASGVGSSMVLQLSPSLSLADLIPSRQGADIVVTIAGSSDAIRFVDALASVDGTTTSRYRVSAAFSDGTTFDLSEYVTAVHGTNSDDSLLGTPGADLIYGAGGNDLINGAEGNDKLNGGAGNDTLVGGQGTDTLRGNAGNDTYHVDADGDRVFELPGEGIDTVESDAPGYALASLLPDDQEIENLKLLEGVAQSGSGNKLSNQIIGNSLDNVLWGGAGNDSLQGNAGNDNLDGGWGNDSLEGGTGNDTYAFRPGDGQDVIVDTAGAFDILTMDGDITPNQISLSRVSNDLVIVRTGTSDSITVKNYFNGALAGAQAIEEIYYYNDDTVWTQFTIASRVGNRPPVVVAALADKSTAEDAAFNLVVPANTFADPDAGNTLSYSAKLESGASLPSWLTFNPATRALSGTPANAHVGVLQIKVTATDPAGASASDVFGLTVTNTNDAPTVAQALPAQAGRQGQAYSLTVPAATFADVDVGDTLRYALTKSDGTALPTWLTFNTTTRVLTGTPANANVGTTALRLTATDSVGASASTQFNLAVANVNDAPVLSTALADATGKVGTALSLTLPSTAFSDIDAGDTLTYSARLADGTALPGWLSFNAGTRSFTGTPAAAGTLGIRVTATDVGGLAASDIFDLVVTSPALTLTGTAGADTLTGGIGADTLSGLGGNDSLQGGAGNDRLDGGAGSDRMTGGSGDDLYIVDSASDVITEASNEGIDSVQSSVSYTLGNNVENMTLLGSGALQATGNALNNTLVGNGGNNTLIGNDGGDGLDGAAGNDSLDGGAGNDILDGGAGNDTLTGGTGADSYRFGRGSGIDTVQEDDATAGVKDLIVLQGTVTKTDVKFVKASNNLEMSILGTSDKLVFKNWYMGSRYQAEEFRFTDGSVLTNTQAQALVGAMAAFGASAASNTASPTPHNRSIGTFDYTPNMVM